MKDLSFFLLKNSLAAKMRKGIRTFCHGAGSTTTLDRIKAADRDVPCPAAGGSSSSDEGDGRHPEEDDAAAAALGSPLTLEQMILRLDMEEEAARRAKLDVDEVEQLLHRRMSCVHSSDILRSARNAALSQYPRFSLDGRDAMYRSSFLGNGRRSGRRRPLGAGGECCGGVLRRAPRGLPATVAGDGVVWCRPGVVARLMGLEVVPVPVSGRQGRRRAAGAAAGMQSLRRTGKLAPEKARAAAGVHGQSRAPRRESVGSCCCSAAGGGGSDYCSLAPSSSARPPRGRPDRRHSRAH